MGKILEHKTVGAEFPDLREAWTAVILLLIAYIVAVMDRQILGLLVQPVRAELEISDTQISLLNGFAFVISFTLLGVFFGQIADRKNRRNLIIAGMLVWCIATVMCGFARNFVELFAYRMFVGVGEAALSPAAYSMIADSFNPERRGRAVGVYTLGTFVGSGIAMIAGALAIFSLGNGNVALPLLGEMSSWRAAFIAVGLPGIVVAAALFMVEEPTRKERAPKAIAASAARFFREHLGVFSAMIGGLACNALVSFSLISWTPTVFIRTFRWEATTIGGIYGACLALAGGAGILSGGWLADRLGRKAVHPLVIASWAMAAAALVSPWVGVSPSPVVGITALAAASFLFAIPTGIAPLAIYRITPNEFRGTAVAIYLLAATATGLGIGPTLVALVNEGLFGHDNTIGWALAIISASVPLIGFILLRLAVRLDPTESRRTGPCQPNGN